MMDFGSQLFGSKESSYPITINSVQQNPLQNLIVVHLVKKIHTLYGSRKKKWSSQGPTTEHNPKPEEFNQHPISLRSVLILSSDPYLVTLLHSGFPTQFFYTFFIYSCVLYVPPISSSSLGSHEENELERSGTEIKKEYVKSKIDEFETNRMDPTNLDEFNNVNTAS
jgi:hypothetical protein